MNSIELGKFLSKLRQEKGLTQEKLAELLNIDKRKVSRWETGISTPEFDMLIKLSEILDITLYELSIGKRIKSKNICEKAKEHFKTINDYQRYSLKRTIITFMSIFIGLLLGFTAIFTIDDYQKTAIYSFYSIDKDYEMRGVYIKVHNYGFIFINNLTIQGNSIYESGLYNNIVHYEILNRKKESLIRKANTFPTDNSFFYHELFNENINFDEKEKYTFIFNYYDDNKIVREISFEFKIIQKYTNDLFSKTIY